MLFLNVTPQPPSHSFSLSYFYSMFIYPPLLVSPLCSPLPILTALLYAPAAAVGHWQEFRADRAAALSHKSYTQGGIKLMQTHIELESLLRYMICVVSDSVATSLLLIRLLHYFLVVNVVVVCLPSHTSPMKHRHRQ